MTKRSHTIQKKDPQHTQVWEWEETPETIEALKQLHDNVVNSRLNRPHDYQGPLYAPHPDVDK